MSHDLSIRPLRTPEEYEACVALQRATWGDDFRELVPPALLQISQKVGGVAAGAFADGRLVGFVYGITGLRDGRPVHWSHMLAVDESRRDRGIGRHLKEYQREQLAAAGVERMYWTFDPLVARNAHLNLNVLGARVVEYARDMYGENPMSRTDSVIGTDRFVVAWDLRPAVPRPGEGGRSGTKEDEGDGERPLISSEHDPLQDAWSLLVVVPSDIQALKRTDRDAALAWRRSTRRAFEHYLPRGYAVSRLVPHPAGDGSCYVLERPA
jgi:chorismate synthase